MARRQRIRRTWKYRAWKLDENNEPVEGVEEEFTSTATTEDVALATAYHRAAKALVPLFRRKESIWVEEVHCLETLPLNA